MSNQFLFDRTPIPDIHSARLVLYLPLSHDCRHGRSLSPSLLLFIRFVFLALYHSCLWRIYNFELNVWIHEYVLQKSTPYLYHHDYLCKGGQFIYDCLVKIIIIFLWYRVVRGKSIISSLKNRRVHAGSAPDNGHGSFRKHDFFLYDRNYVPSGGPFTATIALYHRTVGIWRCRSLLYHSKCFRQRHNFAF